MREYEERTEKAEARTARNSIALSVGIAFLFAVLRVINVIKNGYELKYMGFIAVEFTVIIAGTVCLCIGSIRKSRLAEDGQHPFDEAGFYRKASAIVICIILGIYSILLPQSLIVEPIPDLSFGSLPVILLFTVGVYAICSLKRNGIFVNHSFIGSDDHDKRVWKNIGKIALVSGSMLLISLFSAVLLTALQKTTHHLLSLFLSIILTYLLLLTAISAFYLLYSALEKSSFDSKTLLSKASMVPLFITIALQMIRSAFVILIDRLPISQVSAAITIVLSMNTFILLAWLIFLTYFAYEYQKNKPDKMVDLSCKVLLFGQVLNFLSGNMVNCLTYIFNRQILDNDPYVINNILNAISNTLDGVFGIVLAVGVAMLIAALIGNKTISKVHIVAIVAMTVMLGVNIFLQTQIDHFQMRIFESLCELVVLMYLSLIVVHIGKQRANDEKTPNGAI